MVHFTAALLLAAGAVASERLTVGNQQLEIDDTISFTELHMKAEHHMDQFDLSSFFHLHDYNRDRVLDAEEIESIYGVHHDKLKKSNGDVEQIHTDRAKAIIKVVLDRLDENGDGVLTMNEFLKKGLRGLPNFQGIEHLGHHYDEEEEFFLHHEEEFHSTPETMEPEAYTHPEDIEHFGHHDQIEEEEHRRLVLFTHDFDADEEQMERQAKEAEEEKVIDREEENRRQERMRQANAQLERLMKDRTDGRLRSPWGTGQLNALFRGPRDRADRFRKEAPYKYRMGKAWLGRAKPKRVEIV